MSAVAPSVRPAVVDLSAACALERCLLFSALVPLLLTVLASNNAIFLLVTGKPSRAFCPWCRDCRFC